MSTEKQPRRISQSESQMVARCNPKKGANSTYKIFPNQPVMTSSSQAYTKPSSFK